jgi:hypothetical protein
VGEELEALFCLRVVFLTGISSSLLSLARACTTGLCFGGVDATLDGASSGTSAAAFSAVFGLSMDFIILA